MPLDKTSTEALRKYAWDYFALHAGQRMAGFQFFITLSTAIVGAYIVLARNQNATPILAVLGGLLSVLAFVFYRLDARVRQLIHNGEGALRFLDSLHQLSDVDGLPHPLRIVERDEIATARRPNRRLRLPHFSYTVCFRVVHVTFGLLGLAAFAAALVSS